MPDRLGPGSRVVVTGGHGFIGRHVVEALASIGCDAVAIAHPKGDLVDLPGETVRIDLSDAIAVNAVVDGADAVVHLAARAGGVQFQQERGTDVYRSNRDLTDAVLSAAQEGGVGRVFLASSMVVYRPATEPLSEQDPLLSVGDDPSSYAWSKISDEVVASWFEDLKVVVGRFGNVYGPGAPFDPERSSVVHALIDRAARLADGEPLTVWGDGSAVRSFVFVEDVADAVARVLTDGRPGTAYNVDSGEAVTVGHVAGWIVDAISPGTKVVFDPSKPSGPAMRVASIDRLRGLGFEPMVPLAEGLARTLEWYRGTA